jgi:hypothetical protein
MRVMSPSVDGPTEDHMLDMYVSFSVIFSLLTLLRNIRDSNNYATSQGSASLALCLLDSSHSINQVSNVPP